MYTRAWGDDPTDIDWRKDKRLYQRDAVAVASTQGELAAELKIYCGRLKRNPYPPGRRHDAWQHAYEAYDDAADDWQPRRE